MAAFQEMYPGSGTSISNRTLNAALATGEVSVFIREATGRANAIATAAALYPTHPDNASISISGNSATFVGFTGCGKQTWEVHLSYGTGAKNAGKAGVFAKGYSGYEYTANDKHDYFVSTRVFNTTLDAVIAAYTIGTTGPNGEPYSSHSAHIVDTTVGGDTVEITVNYRFPNDQYEAKSRTAVGQKAFPHLPGEDLRTVLTTTALNTLQELDIEVKPGALKLSAVIVPTKEISVYWQSVTSSAGPFESSSGKINSASYTIAGKTYAAGTLRYDGSDESDFGATIATRFKTVLRFTAVPYKEAWYEIAVGLNVAPVDPNKPYSYSLTNPYSDAGSQAAFPTPPTYIP